jgi:hypothetical protein
MKVPVPSAPSAPRWLGVENVELVGAPPALEPALREALGWKPGMRWGPLEPYRAARRVREAFPCLSGVRVRRSWSGRAARFEAALREPAAAIVRGGKREAYLGRDGTVFAAPEGVYAEPLPVVGWGERPAAAELGELARLLAAAALPGALPAGLKGLRRGEDGWTISSADGAELLWGPLEWTDEKISRLKEVYDDALPRFGALQSADLRHFGDGKIMVTPR